jgi:hypothetical protein
VLVASRQSQVDAASVLRQAVLNTSSPIELFREAVSNSVDADARSINIRLVNAGGDVWNVLVEDDGNGMEDRHMSAFFNAGETEKDFTVPGGTANLSIGEKGLGSKTTFVARDIEVESVRHLAPSDVRVGRMHDPMAKLRAGQVPDYTVDLNPTGHVRQLIGHGTRIALDGLLIPTFNGKKSMDADEIAQRLMHYLRTMCATGTVKNRHAAKAHIHNSVINVGNIPAVTVEVVSSKTAALGPESGSYAVPATNVAPSGGMANAEGVQINSALFCDTLDFGGSRTMSVGGQTVTIYYDGTAIIAGEAVRQQMLKYEFRQGQTQKSLMGVHLSKDFIPMRNDNSLSRDLLGGEYYYEYKVFLNCQSFQLNADRNVVTNVESDEISWIWEDFKTKVWPQIQAKALPYNKLKDEEEVATEAIKKSKAAAALKAQYASLPPITITKKGASLQFVKRPRKEADVSHLLAMMVQSGAWAKELAPVVKFGQYIDDSTDVLVEDASGAALLCEVEMTLPNLFKHKHPMDSYDLVVTWDLGGLSSGTAKTAPWGANGAVVPVTLMSTATGWHLKWGTHSSPVLVLESLL